LLGVVLLDSLQGDLFYFLCGHVVLLYFGCIVKGDPTAGGQLAPLGGTCPIGLSGDKVLALATSAGHGIPSPRAGADVEVVGGHLPLVVNRGLGVGGEAG